MSYRYIIHKILKEERVEERTMVRLLSRNRDWNERLSELSINANYSEIIEKHFRSGLTLMIDMKGLVEKETSEVKKELKPKMDELNKKLTIINEARKMLSTFR